MEPVSGRKPMERLPLRERGLRTHTVFKKSYGTGLKEGSMAIEDGRYVCCPLCEGKGQLHRSELTQRINDPKLLDRLHEYLETLKKEERQPLVTIGAPTDSAYEREMHSWPPKRMLWRRSPKE